MSKTIRFAALTRVSTEKQERRGESLHTQRDQITGAVENLGGKIVRWFSGQEHAVEGYERRLLDQMLTEARKTPRPFDAVIVADPTRWSRDNVANETGLDTLRNAGVRFFVLTTEYDLFDPQARLFLALNSTIGAFQAREQKKKSIQNRIKRARKGIPCVRGLPYGRTYDREGGTWGLDPEKLQTVRDVAERYLNGEPLKALAARIPMNLSQLTKILREYCGPTWTLRFRAADLNIDETVTLSVPPLLDDGTIKRVRERLTANRTYLRRPANLKRDYILQGRIFCAACGYLMSGVTKTRKRKRKKDGKTVLKTVRYYQHNACYAPGRCPVRPRPLVRADEAESEVVRRLFDLFGNPALIERAVKAAVPDCEGALKERQKLEADLDRIERGRDRVLDLIFRETITQEDADKKLTEWKAREAEVRKELDRVAARLADVPDEQALRVYVERAKGTVLVYDDEGQMAMGGNTIGTLLAMSQADRRALVSAVFDQPDLSDGRPAGVYVSPGEQVGCHERKRWSFKIRGRLDFECLTTGGVSVTERGGRTPCPAFELV